MWFGSYKADRETAAFAVFVWGGGVCVWYEKSKDDINFRIFTIRNVCYDQRMDQHVC